MNTKAFLLTTAALLYVSGGAVAQTPPATPSEGPRPGGPPRVNPIVAALDTDKDGSLSAAEIAAAGTTLKTLDKNQDGKLAAEELRPPPPPMVSPTPGIVERLMEFDRNKDGKLTSAELPVRMRTLRAQADTDKNGVLTVAELTTHVEKQEAEHAKAEQEAQKRLAAQAAASGGEGQRWHPVCRGDRRRANCT